MERMNEERLVKRVMLSSAEGRNLRGRPKMGCMDGVKNAVREKVLSIEQTKAMVLNKSAWKMIVNDSH